MYLSALDIEKKHLFLDLEIYISNIDGNFSEEEKRMINMHCAEMHIDNNNYECEHSLDEVLSLIRQTMTKKEKRIIFLELVATILADEVYHTKEKEMVNRLSQILEISDEERDNAFSIINDAKSIYKRCEVFIN